MGLPPFILPWEMCCYTPKCCVYHLHGAKGWLTWLHGVKRSCWNWIQNSNFFFFFLKSSKHSALTTTKMRQSNIVLVLKFRFTQVLDLKVQGVKSSIRILFFSPHFMVRKTKQVSFSITGHFYIVFVLLLNLVQWSRRCLIFMCLCRWKWDCPATSGTFINMLRMCDPTILFLQENSTSFKGMNRAKWGKVFLSHACMKRES